MATAPLAAALKPALPADEASEERYQEALRQMTEALDQRKNRLFDPRYLAMAAGIQDPNVRGMGFGAELASGMKAFGQAEEKEFDENRKIAEMRLMMAQSEREQARKQQGLKFFDEPTTLAAVAGAAPGIPGAAKAPSAAPGAPAAPSAPGAPGAISIGDSSGTGVTIGGRVITPNLISRLTLTNPELGKVVADQYKMALDAISVQPTGYLNKATGQFTPFGGKTMVERFVPANAATGQKAMRLEFPEQIAIEFDNAVQSGDSKKLYDIVDRYTKPLPRPVEVSKLGEQKPAEKAAPLSGSAAAQTPGEYKTQKELEQKVKETEQTTEAKALAEGRAKRFENILTAAEDAGSRLALYKTIDSLVAKPNADKIFGIFNRPDFSSALGKLVQGGVGAPGFSVGVPEIQNIMRNIGLPQEQINDYQLGASLLAKMQLEVSKLAQGQGSVSNFERELYASAAITTEDNPATIRKKLALLSARAAFERDVARGLRASKMGADDFRDSDQYQDLLNNYHQRMISVVSPQSSAPSARPAAPAASAPYSLESLRERRDRLQQGAKQ